MKRVFYSILIILGIAFHGHSTLAKPKTISWEDLSPTKDGVNMIFDGAAEMRGTPDISEFEGSKERLDNESITCMYCDRGRFDQRLRSCADHDLDSS